MPLKDFCAFLVIYLVCGIGYARAADSAILQDFSVASIVFPRIGKYTPEIKYTVNSNTELYVKVTWNLHEDVLQDDAEIVITPVFRPAFHWSPHLTPQDGYIIAQHVFRAPAMIGTDKKHTLIIIPDLDVLKKNNTPEWYMDMNVPENVFSLGMSRSAVSEHVLFKKEAGAKYKKGKLVFGFYILINDTAGIGENSNPWRKALSFLWQRWGNVLYKSNEPLQAAKMEKFVAQTYNWAFDSWRKNVWQQFELNGKQVGAPVFIVNVTQSPNYPGVVNEREFRSIWNQAWFSSLRSASGLYRYARRTNNKVYKSYALMTKELALAFPQRQGFFPSVIATEMKEVEINSQKYNRSMGWETKYFANSNRNPYTDDPRASPYHVLDMSYTAYLMLQWYHELEKDDRLLEYARAYGDALLGLQAANGFFPGWLSLKDLTPLDQLNNSPESAMSVSFLLELYALTKQKKYFNAAQKAMDIIIKDVIPVGRWEDFETYWSCSSFGADTLVGKKTMRNNMYKQNTLSMYWTAQALLEMYNTTLRKSYLLEGQKVLDEMLMYQAVWQPPYMYVDCFGGFGVMNADAEWNDSRQSLFANLILSYGKVLNNQEYNERGMAALKASFAMMYSADNPGTFTQWNKKWPFFGKQDYGFMMENYGHDGETNNQGLGIGAFTIYDWGNGAAAAAYNSFLDNTK